MSSPYSGGCDHVKVTASAEPIDNHECHCNVCKNVTGQHTTHVAFFNWGDLKAEGGEKSLAERREVHISPRHRRKQGRVPGSLAGQLPRPLRSTGDGSP